MTQDTTRADAMLQELAEQRNQLGARAAMLAAELAESKKKLAQAERNGTGDSITTTPSQAGQEESQGPTGAGKR